MHNRWWDPIIELDYYIYMDTNRVLIYIYMYICNRIGVWGNEEADFPNVRMDSEGPFEGGGAKWRKFEATGWLGVEKF